MFAQSLMTISLLFYFYKKKREYFMKFKCWSQNKMTILYGNKHIPFSIPISSVRDIWLTFLFFYALHSKYSPQIDCDRIICGLNFISISKKKIKSRSNFKSFEYSLWSLSLSFSLSLSYSPSLRFAHRWSNTKDRVPIN